MSDPVNYECEECHGRGEIECHACGSETECERCNGSGLNTYLIDVTAFNAALLALLKNGVGTCKLWHNNLVVGRRTVSESAKEARLYYSDYPARPTQLQGAPSLLDLLDAGQKPRCNREAEPDLFADR